MIEFNNYENFENNKYYSWYKSLVNKYTLYDSDSNYTENHHILPKSLGGSNDDQNIIFVPARVHYVLHHILIKFTKSNDKVKMCFALHSFFNLKNRYQKRENIISRLSSSKIYKLCKEELSNYRKDNLNYFKNEIYILKNKKTNHIFEGTRKELRDLTGLTHQELSNLITNKNKCLKGWGIKLNDNTFSFEKPRAPQAKSYKICPHCDKKFDTQNYARWHGNKCKEYVI